MKAVVAAFNQEKALVGDFSVIMNLRMELFEALLAACWSAFCQIIKFSTLETAAEMRTADRRTVSPALAAAAQPGARAPPHGEKTQN